MKKLELAGKRFGKLVAIESSETRNGNVLWRFKCDCGNEKVMMTGSIVSGRYKSCGCDMQKWRQEFGKSNKWSSGAVTHGKCYTPEYRAWQGMKSRCYHKGNQNYKNYGGRGIVVCDKWKDDFAQFYKDMGDKPGTEYSIERIDNNGNYSANNCKWETRKGQRRNTRRNVYVEYQGKNMCMRDWAEFFGIDTSTMSNRSRKLGHHGAVEYYSNDLLFNKKTDEG